MISYLQNFERSWSRHFFMQLTTLTVLTASFALVTFFLILSLNFKRVLAEWSKEVQITAYLKDGISQPQINEIESKIKAATRVEQLTFISQVEAIERFKKQLSSYAPDLLKEGGFETA